MPAAAVRDDRVDLDELWGPMAGQVLEAMVEAPEVERAAVALEAALVPRIANTAAPDPLAAAIAERVGASGAGYPDGRWLMS